MKTNLGFWLKCLALGIALILISTSYYIYITWSSRLTLLSLILTSCLYFILFFGMLFDGDFYDIHHNKK
jgi:hypothetical protein